MWAHIGLSENFDDHSMRDGKRILRLRFRFAQDDGLFPEGIGERILRLRWRFAQDDGLFPGGHWGERILRLRSAPLRMTEGSCGGGMTLPYNCCMTRR